MRTELKNRLILHGDVSKKLSQIPDNSIDEIVTDPPYGYSFMNKDWDKVVIGSSVWKECLRVLKPGSFAFIMSAPRQDVLCRVMINLEKAGFVTGFTSIYWAYASGFPKAMNVSKAVDKRNARTPDEYKELGNRIKQQREKLNIPTKTITELFPSKTGGLTGCLWNWEHGENVPTKQQWEILKQKLNLDNRFDELIEREEAQREIISKQEMTIGIGGNSPRMGKEKIIDKPETEQAKKLDGSYAGFQPKPALEVILVCMKPLSEKNYVEQALSNGHGITWLDDCRIPYKNENDKDSTKWGNQTWNSIDYSFKPEHQKRDTKNIEGNPQGRFPANLLVSDNVLDVGKINKDKPHSSNNKVKGGYSGGYEAYPHFINTDSGDFSRYYSLDSWEAQFIITPKPSKSEKNDGLNAYMSNSDKYQGKFPCSKKLSPHKVNDGRNKPVDNPFQRGETVRQNIHPTVKPVELFKYLISMGSRPDDFILDPFMGSGTTAIACEKLARKWIGVEINEEYCQIIEARVDKHRKQERLF